MPASHVAFSLVTLTLLYLVLAVVGLGLAFKYGTRDDIYGEKSEALAYES